MSLLPLVGKSGVVGLGPPLLVWSYSQQRDVCRAQAAWLGHSGVVAAAARKARVQTARQEPTRPHRTLVSNMMSVVRCANSDPRWKLVSHTYKCKTADRHIKVQMALAFCISMPRTLDGMWGQHLAQQAWHLFQVTQMSLLPLVGKSGVVGLGPPLLVWSYSQ